MMEVQVREDNYVEFFVDGFQPSFLNLIRRYAISRVPVLAIDRVVFYENNSSFWDEYLAHRIGLVPIVTPETLPEEIEIYFSIDVDKPGKIYSSDLKSEDKEVKVALDNIPLFTLVEGQSVKLEGFAKLGIAAQHAKFQAGLVSFDQESEKQKMFVETFYQMSPSDLISRTCNLILKDIDNIRSVL